MNLMSKMKVSVIGASQDAIFFIKRSEYLKRDIKFSIFDSKETQDSLKKTFNLVETPWNIKDVLKDSNLILNGCSVKKYLEFFEIIKNNKSELPIIDLSLLKSKSIQDYKDNQIKNTVLHSMPIGKMNIDFQKD